MDRAVAHAADLVRFRPDIIVARFTPVRAAKEATTTIPIVINLKTAERSIGRCRNSVLLSADEVIE